MRKARGPTWWESTILFFQGFGLPSQVADQAALHHFSSCMNLAASSLIDIRANAFLHHMRPQHRGVLMQDRAVEKTGGLVC